MRKTSWNTVSPKKIGLGYRCTILHSRGHLCYTGHAQFDVFLWTLPNKIKQSIGWPQVPWEISLYKTTTQNPGPQYVYQGDKNTGSPPIPYWTMAGIFFKGQGIIIISLFTVQYMKQNKTGYFNTIFTFGSKYTRQTADVDLGREGIEVFHSNWAPFHRVSPGRKRQVHHRS